MSDRLQIHRRPFPLLLAALMLVLPAPGWADSLDLPDLGDPSAQQLSAADEALISRYVLRQKRQTGEVIDDPELSGYIEHLGNRLLAGSGLSSDDYHFIIVDQPSINATTWPGGLIAIHSGLITASRSEDELAAVIAHEIAHVHQRHIVRWLEKTDKMSLPILLAAVATMLASNDPEVTEAAAITAMAVPQQLQIDYTRAHETEADSVGIGILSNAGFDPASMASFFQRLQQRQMYAGTVAPEFLRTHPVNEERIASALDRSREHTYQLRGNDTTYRYMQAKLLAMTHPAPDQLLEQLQARVAEGRTGGSNSERFALALTLQRLGRLPQALTVLSPLLDDAPQHLAVTTAHAELLLDSGRIDEAIAAYRSQLELYPGNSVLVLGYSKALIAANHHDQARQQLTALLHNSPDNRYAYLLLAEVEASAGDQDAANIARAEYYFHSDQLHSAIELLTQTQTSPTLSFIQREGVDARLQQLSEMVTREQER